MSVLDTEPTLGDVLHAIWRAKISIFIGAALGVLVAAILLTLSVPQYRAEMLVGPAERQASGSDIKALLPDNSSFAVQYLVSSLGSRDSTDFMRFEQTLRGTATARILMEDDKIKNGAAMDRPFTTSPKESLKTPEHLAAYLSKNVIIETVGTTPMRRIIYRHPDPTFAVYLLTRLQQIGDGMIREDVRTTAENRAQYLEKELETTANPDHRRALTALLMEQEHVRMLLSIDEPFAAMIAEPAAASPKPDRPRKSLLVASFMMIGAFLGYALHAVRRR
jgi:LPS O-antigen subunit length determinant protein (WzzB/FepE family)